MRWPDHKDLAAIVALFAAPYTLANAVAWYWGYALPFGKIDALSTAQRIAAASLSAIVLLALLLVGLLGTLSRLQRVESGAIAFAWSLLAVLFGGVILAALTLAFLEPLMDVPELRAWRVPAVIVAELVWCLAAFLFYLGVGENG